MHSGLSLVGTESDQVTFVHIAHISDDINYERQQEIRQGLTVPELVRVFTLAPVYTHTIITTDLGSVAPKSFNTTNS